ncbi:MAG: hypothetical protein ACT4PK_04225 [Gammaproteobacteria bacterium]
MKHVALAVMLGVALAGCSSSEEDPTEAFCTTFGTVPPAAFTLNCNAGCTLSNAAFAYDEDLDTTASIVPVNGQTSYTAVLMATAAADQPAGADVGVFVSQPQNRQSMTNSIRTYLNGNLQETLAPGNTVIRQPDTGSPADGFLGMRTTLAYDQVEFTATITWGAGQTPVYFVYEVCNDGGEA